MVSKTFPPTAALFKELRPDLLDKTEEIKVSLGINPAFADRLTGTGNVPCCIFPKLKSGGYAGMASSPGFVVNLDFAQLVEAGFAAEDIWFALGANVGEWADPDGEHTGEPICGECLSVSPPIGHAHYEGLDPGAPCEECDPEEPPILVRTYTGGEKPCYSCVLMIDVEDL